MSEPQSAEYIKGYVQGIDDFAERVKKYYNNLHGKTNSAVVSYNIDLIAKEMKEKREKV